MITTNVIQTVTGGNLINALSLTVKATKTSSLLCAIVANGKTAPVTTVTDSAGNTWSKLYSDDNAVQGSFWATTAAKPLSITTLSVNTGGANELINAMFFEIAGANNASPIDITKGANAGSGTAASTAASANPGWSRDLIIGMVTWLGGANSTADTGATFTPEGAGTTTFIDNAGVPSAHWKSRINYLWQTSQNIETFATTLPESGSWVAIEVMLKPFAQIVTNYQFPHAPDGMSVTEVR